MKKATLRDIILFSASTGTIIGLLQVFVSGSLLDKYALGMFAHLSESVALALDRSVFVCLLTAVAGSVLYVFSLRVRPIMRSLLLSGASTLLVIAIGFPMIRDPQCRDWMLGISFSGTMQALVDTPFALAGMLAVLAIGAFVLVKLRSNPVRGDMMPSHAVEPRHVYRTGRPVVFLRVVSITIVAVAVLVNAAFLTFKLRNLLTLHGSPNVVYVMVDTLRLDRVGCYGSQARLTPNIDWIASHSMVFEDALATSSWTCPSVASFLSGRHINIPLYITPGRMPTDIPLMSEILSDRGYTTGGVIGNFMADGVAGLNRGFDRYRVIEHAPGSGASVTDSAIEMLDDLKHQRFFLFLVYADPHAPYFDHSDVNDSEIQGKSVAEADLYDNPNLLPRAKKLYDEEVTFVDRQIGRLIRHMESLELYDDALLVFLSDHGEEFGDHGGYGHGRTLYDEVVHVPLIIKLPGMKAQKRVMGTFSLVDLWPVVATTLGIEIRHPSDNRRPSALTLSYDHVPESSAFARTDFNNIHLMSVRRQSKVCIHDKTVGRDEFMLFDVTTDKAQKTDISGLKPDLTEQMRVLLGESQFLWAQTDAPHAHTEEEITERDMQRLRSLGYVN